MLSKKAIIAGIAGLLVISRATGGGTAQVPSPSPNRTESLKERLSDKSSDKQRVDNCKVPHNRRGSRPRPQGCSRVGATASQPK